MSSPITTLPLNAKRKCPSCKTWQVSTWRAPVRIPVHARDSVNHGSDETCQVSIDFFFEKLIMVELKAVIQLEDVHLAQAMNYLEAYNMEIGLLINFGAKSLQFKRVHNNKLNLD